MKKIALLVIAVIMLGAFLHFRNLNGAVYMNEDEARAFTLMDSGPLIYLLCRPALSVSPQESTAFYVAATLGLAGIIIFYLLCRMLFDEAMSAYALMFYTVFPYRINYSRMLYPAVFIDFFVMLLLFSFFKGFLKKKPALMIFTGVFSAALIYVHPFSYSVLFGFIAASACYWYFNRERMRGAGLSRFAGCYILGFLLGYFVLQQTLLSINPNYEYTVNLFGFGKYITDATRITSNNLLNFFLTLKGVIFSSGWAVFRAVFVFSALSFSAILAFRNKNYNLIFFFISAVSGVLIFLAMTVLKVHEIRDRHFVWLCPVLSLSIAYFIVSLKDSRNNYLIRAGMILGAAVFLATSVFESYMVTVETYNTVYIRKWLAQNQIRKSQVLTCLHLHSEEDEEDVALPPVRKHPSWAITAQKYQIIWPLVYRAYLAGMFSYIIPSGMSSNVTLGNDDPVLANVKPVKSWVHPYSGFKYRFFDFKTVKGSSPQMINVYRLADVFSEGNLRSILARYK